MEISEITTVTPEVVEAFHRLIPQLSSSAPPGHKDLEAILKSESSTIFAARDPSGRLVGLLTLVIYRVPTSVRAVIEDVVVDESARGQGIGEALSRAALKRASEAGAPSVDLSSRPERAAANRLYLRLGFVLRESNCYRYHFKNHQPG